MSRPCAAVLFDTGGTVLDWHGSLVDEVGAIAAWQGSGLDAHAFVNDWRRRAMRGIVGQRQPAFHMDDVHLRTLDEMVLQFGPPPLDPARRDGLWRGWHRLRAQRPVVSFTMLPTTVVVDVSRRNGLVWDAIVSCQMIGTYKPHPEAYLTAARWLGHRPEELLMVACHNFDLNAAQDVGMQTAFVRRPDEWGPEGPPDPQPNRAYDHVVDGFDALAARLLPAG